MMKDELEMQNPEKEKPVLVAVSTFLAFILFGVIPLAPYLLASSNTALFPLSIASTAIALFLLGILRAVVTSQNALRGITETLVVGSISASAAFFVGTLFRI